MSPRLILCIALLVPLLCASFAPAGPAPAASASPAAKGELESLLEKIPAGDPAEVFGRLEDYVQAEDAKEPRIEAVARARAVLARFDAIRKAAPPPPEKVEGELAQLLFTVGRALEEGGAPADALPVYQRIVSEFPKAVWEGGLSREPIAVQAKARIQWQSTPHPWVAKDADALLAKLKAAFAKHDHAGLSALISRIGFWSGPFAAEGGADDPERVLKLLDGCWPKDRAVEVAADVEPFSDKDRQLFLKVAGFTGEFPEIYAILEREADGWQWSGVAFASKPGQEPAEPEDASPTPAPSPSPKGK